MGIVQRTYFSFLLLLFALLLGATASFAQENATVVDTNTVQIKGKEFYKYVVKPGNTVYAISRMYNVSVHDIEEYNPQTAQGLNIGDTLFILAVTKDKESMQKKMEVDGNIITHEVQKKQTLYAISKIYGIKASDIMEVNPEIKKGLKEGQLIKIPISKLKEEEVKSDEVLIDESKYIKHEVQSKETLYSLSKTYGVSIDSIKSANKGLVEGLKVGQIIAIPKEGIGERSIDSTLFKKRYNVAFILPFFLDLNDTLISRLKINDQEKVLNKSAISLQFYQGALIAIDSLRKQGFQFDIRFYDSAKDTAAANALIDQGKLDDLDLIIGPFYLSQFLRVAEYAQKKKIHMVCPVPQNNKILLGNAYVSKVATSKNIMFKNVGAYVAHLFRSQNIIIVNKNFRADPLSNAFKIEFMKSMDRSGDTISTQNVKEVKWDKGSIEPIAALLSDDSVYNIIVVPSDDQVYVSELLSKLNVLSGKYMFKVIGQDQWFKYANIDFDYLENLGVMIPVDGFTNYEDKKVKSFLKSYYKSNEIFPEKFAFQGFDITYFYLKQLHDSGNRIESALTEADERYLYFKFKFFKTGMESGYENSSTVLLEYKDYQLKEVKLSH